MLITFQALCWALGIKRMRRDLTPEGSAEMRHPRVGQRARAPGWARSTAPSQRAPFPRAMACTVPAL